jgi:hypothetical protein
MVCLPLGVSANSGPPPNYFYYYISNANANVKYADVLIKINPKSANYSQFNLDNAKPSFNEKTPIVAYNEDSYMSLTFHFAKAKSDMSYSGGCSQLVDFRGSISDITPSIKIALLDENGNILKISKEISIISQTKNRFARAVNYNANGDVPSIRFEDTYNQNYIISAMLILSIFLRMLISVTTETLIAIPFKIKPLYKIIIVNIITQAALIAFVLFSGLPYATTMIIGEIVVYASEYLTYIMMFKSVSKSKLAIYTVTANTATLLLGLLFNQLHFLVG